MTNPTFVRSFPYQTIPVYGYLLSLQQDKWNKSINAGTNLTKFFIHAFGIKLPDNLASAVEMISGSYNGKQIVEEETKREEETKKQIALYKSKFVEQPHFEIAFEQMSISFDPRNIMPLGQYGTVYPTIRVTDKWGVLTVSNGALISPQWDKITISNPEKTVGNKITGDGWILDLEEGYALVKNDDTGNYMLKKK